MVMVPFHDDNVSFCFGVERDLVESAQAAKASCCRALSASFFCFRAGMTIGVSGVNAYFQPRSSIVVMLTLQFRPVGYTSPFVRERGG